MKDVDDDTKRLARSSLIWYGLGLVCGIVLAVFLVANTIRMIVYPVRAATESAVAIGAGNLDQVVPITSDDELGQLASAFNTMARQLREFRQSHKAQLIRAQRTSQATIDSFPEPVLVVDPEDRVEMANPAARRLFGLPHPEHAGAAPPVWEPPEALRQPLAEALHEQRAYVPEGFDKVIVLQPRGTTPFLSSAGPADPRCLVGHVGGRRAAGRRDAVPPLGRSEEQHGGHGQPRVEDAADEHPPGAAPAPARGRGAAAAEAT